MAVIDRLLAERLWPGEDPIGRPLRWVRGDLDLRVVAVVEPILHRGVDRPAEPTVYRPYRQNPLAASLWLVLRSGERPQALARTLARTLRRHDPDLALAEVGPIAERVRAGLAPRRLRASLMALFAVAALAVAALGLFALLAQAVVERRRELAVRLALGASPRRLARRLWGEGGRLVALGLLLGWAGWAVAAPLFAALLFDLAPHDARAIAITTLLVAAVGLLAGALPARAALRVDPRRALGE